MTTLNQRPPSPDSNGKRPFSVPSPATDAAAPKPPQPNRSAATKKFEHPLMLQQSSLLSRVILWTLMAVATSAVAWAYFAKIEEAIPALGKLEPEGTVSNVHVPVNGVVKEVHIKDGQSVKRGALLVNLDPTTSKMQLQSLKQVRETLQQENQFYQSQLQGKAVDIMDLQIPSAFINLTKSREALIAENNLFQAQLSGSTQGLLLTATERERLRSNQAELETRSTAARLETEQVGRQLRQVQVKLSAAQKTLALNQKILNNLTPLAETGAIAQIQYLKQQNEVEANQSEVDQLLQEQIRLQLAITQSQAKTQNTVDVDRREITTRIAENEKRLAEIDSQIMKAIVENNKRIAEIDSQITQAQQVLKYEQVRSPVDGVVFDLKATHAGFVANSAEPILKVVPTDSLVAKVSITNQDIGFVREGMTVDVRIDSFPYSEFGDIKGTLVWIGSDALPPTQIQPYYTFPAKIRLHKQSLNVKGREIRLQSGMSLNANIKVRERTVMSIFLDQFTKAAESLKTVR